MGQGCEIEVDNVGNDSGTGDSNSPSNPDNASKGEGGTGGFTAISYNLQWHEEQHKSGSNSVFGVLQKQLPADVIGFQEMDDVQKVIRSSLDPSWQGYQSAASLAWN